MTWTILIIKKPHNGWFVNYIENKLLNQIQKFNLQQFIEVLIYETNTKFYSDYVSVIDDEIDISDNYIDIIYNKIKTGSDCIGLKGTIYVNGNPIKFNNVSKTENEICLPITKLNPIKTKIIFNKINNIIYYINSENLLNITENIDNIDTPIIFLEKIVNIPISIIITAYQTQDYIEECLDSIEKQTYFINNDNFEILVGVDACQETYNKLQEIKHKYRNLSIYMMSENKGTYITTNTLIDLVKNENVIRFDSDDIMTPNLVKEVFNNKKDNDVIMLGYVDIKDGKLDSNLCVAGGIIYFKKSVMDNIAGGYQPWTCAADSEMMIRIMNKVKIMQLKKILFYRRIHDNSLTNRIDTKHNSIIRNNYTKQIKTRYKDDEIKIDRIVNNIIENNKEIVIKDLDKYNLVFAISTYNRLNFLKITIDTWYNTCDKKHNWILIVADDGSDDGTLEYLYNLSIDNVKIYIIENKRRGVHHQTNSILKFALNLNFDYGFKSDDDLIFLKNNWDNQYINASIITGYYHLIFYDKKWGNKRHEQKNSTFKNSLLENCVSTENIQGAFWTFTKKIIEDVGYFDTNLYNLCGLGHIDYSIRCCKLGYNDIKTPFDIINSNLYIKLNNDHYISHNNFKKLWNTNEIINNKKKHLFDERTYMPYNEYNKNLLNDNVKKYDISFIIPFRNREDQINGLEFNIKNMFDEYNYEIIYVNQDDNKLFKRGQLCNIGFKESKGDIVVFQDIDIRHLRKINFKELLNNYKKPFVAFDSISQLNEKILGEYEIIETEKRPYGFGACAVFYRDQFILSGGFSNLIFGWGVEDTIMNKRVNEYIRLEQNLGHVYHTPLRKDPNVFNSEWYKNNKFILNTESQRKTHADGYIQTTYKYSRIEHNNIINLNIKDISVINNYEYIELFKSINK